MHSRHASQTKATSRSYRWFGRKQETTALETLQRGGGASFLKVNPLSTTPRIQAAERHMHILLVVTNQLLLKLPIKVRCSFEFDYQHQKEPTKTSI